MTLDATATATETRLIGWLFKAPGSDDVDSWFKLTCTVLVDIYSMLFGVQFEKDFSKMTSYIATGCNLFDEEDLLLRRSKINSPSKE